MKKDGEDYSREDGKNEGTAEQCEDTPSTRDRTRDLSVNFSTITAERSSFKSLLAAIDRY